MSRKRRTAQEIAAEYEQKAQEARNKAAAAEAKDHESLKPIFDEIDRISTDLLDAKKGFRDGPQSFANRIEAKLLWISQIRAEEAYARSAQNMLETQRDYLKDQIGKLAADIVAGKKVDSKVTKTLENLPVDETVENLRQDYLAAENDRKSFTSYVKLPKKMRENENGQSLSGDPAE